jgi:23S rRNA (pseudouridine1915-N3)-methyltransferase
VDDAFGIYTERFPREWKFRLDAIAMVRRNKNDRSVDAMAAEGERILAKLRPNEQVVLLDEHGRQLTSKSLAENLSTWQNDGRDLCFVIGGPDGVSKPCRQRADMTWSLSQSMAWHECYFPNNFIGPGRCRPGTRIIEHDSRASSGFILPTPARDIAIAGPGVYGYGCGDR